MMLPVISSQLSALFLPLCCFSLFVPRQAFHMSFRKGCQELQTHILPAQKPARERISLSRGLQRPELVLMDPFVSHTHPSTSHRAQGWTAPLARLSLMASLDVMRVGRTQAVCPVSERGAPPKRDHGKQQLSLFNRWVQESVLGSHTDNSRSRWWYLQEQDP